MAWEAWLTLAVVAATVVVLARERLSPPFAVLGAVVILLVAGVIDAGQAFAGFSNPAPITVAALYVLAAATEVTGALEGIVERLAGHGRGGRRRLARLTLPTAAASAFLNNTTIVAMIAPRIAVWSRRSGEPASRYLMPLSFAAVLGGLMTLMGSSTNIVVSGLLIETGQPPLGFFEIGRVGLPAAVAGLAVIVLLAPRLVPPRRTPGEQIAGAREFTVEMVVDPGSPLIGKAVADAGLRNLEGVFLVQIERNGRVIAPVGPEELLSEGDRLTFAGNVGRVLDLQGLPGLASAEEPHFTIGGEGSGPQLFEAVVAPGSALAGATLKEIGFRGRYGAAVIAIHRAGSRIPAKLGQVTLHPGDVLLVLADTGFRGRWHDQHDFLVVSPVDGRIPPQRSKAPIVGLVGAGLVTSVTLGAIDILQASLLAAIALVATRVLTPRQARESVDLNVIVLIAASFGLGAAMLQSGLAATTGRLLVDGFGRYGDLGILLGVLLATTVLTELVTNNAAAILMFPIAMATASGAGLAPRPFAIAVALGASASFLTPIGYQTNTMVYGMGGYRFTDFTRAGSPLTLIMLAVGLLVIPLAWPLR